MGWSTGEAPHEKEHKYVGDKIVEAIKGVHGKDYVSERTIELYQMMGSAADWFYGEEATKANNGRPFTVTPLNCGQMALLETKASFCHLKRLSHLEKR